MLNSAEIGFVLHGVSSAAARTAPRPLPPRLRPPRQVLQAIASDARPVEPQRIGQDVASRHRIVLAQPVRVQLRSRLHPPPRKAQAHGRPPASAPHRRDAGSRSPPPRLHRSWQGPAGRSGRSARSGAPPLDHADDPTRRPCLFAQQCREPRPRVEPVFRNPDAGRVEITVDRHPRRQGPVKVSHFEVMKHPGAFSGTRQEFPPANA